MICSNFRTRIGFCRSKRPLALSSWFQMWYLDTNQWFIFLFTILQFELIKFAFQIRFQLVQNSCIQIRCLFFPTAVWTVLKIFINILFHWKIKNRTNKKFTESIAAFIMREWAFFKLLSLKNDPPSSFSNDSLYWVTARFLAVNISSSIFFFSKKSCIIKNDRYSI